MSNSATARRRHERDVRRRKLRQRQARAAQQAALTRMMKAAARQFAGKPTILRDAKGVFHIRAGSEHYRMVHP